MNQPSPTVEKVIDFFYSDSPVFMVWLTLSIPFLVLATVYDYIRSKL